MYVLGSSLNVRKEPSAQAEVVEKLPIGTECRAFEPAQGEWLKVCCGGKPGFVSASLVGPEKPSADIYRAEAQDAQRPLAQRLEGALRAATLVPEDAGLRKLLGELFYQRHLELAAADKKPRQPRTFRSRCHQQDAGQCIRSATGHRIRSASLWTEARDGVFVSAIGTPERVIIYRGRYRYPQKRKDSESYWLTGEVFATESFTPTPVLEEALFHGEYGTHYQDDFLGVIPLGQFVLDDASQELLRGIPQQWGRLEVNPKAEGIFEGPWFEMLWNCPEKRPIPLEFEPDLHGRWRLSIPLEDAAWISAVEKAEGGLLLTWVRESEDDSGKRFTSTKSVLFKLPREGEDVAYLGDVPYTNNLRRYSKKNHYPCR